MNFAWPHLLALLVVPALLLVAELASARRGGSAGRPKILRAEAGLRDVSLVDDGPRPGARRKVWLCCGLALAIVALARPQWGRLSEPVFDQSREIIIAVDLSRSMLTPDVTPTRLERARLLIESLLDRLAGERVGLVAFAGTSFLQSPLSADYEILREFLPSLGPDFMPVGGTNYGAMIDTAADAFDSKADSDRYLIVLSDGGATDEDWRSHLGKLGEKGVRVIGLGIGTDKGGFIPDLGGGFMKDERGAVVLARLESATLQELARKTGGQYRDASDWVNLPGLLKATVEAGRKGRFIEKNTIRYAERYQWALAPAVLCLLMSFWLEFPVRPRPRSAILKGGHQKPEGATTLVAAALCAASLIGIPLAARAAAAEATAPPAALAPGDLLGRIVGRLSAAEAPGGLDWAELGRQTVTWGQHLQSDQQPVTPGPVRDALEAVDRGSALDPKAADWPRLRSDLEILLRKTPEPQQQQQKQQNQSQNQSEQQKSEQRKEERKEQQQSRQNQPREETGRPGREQSQPSPERRPEETQPRTGPQGMQQVGGSRLDKARDPAAAKPELAVPIQKLEQVRNQDSPAELYQMIENNEPRPPAEQGRNW